ncbi:DUF4167 domain-containing protein [Chelativorans sp. YIM 93263]|uniref:DUF4167 domain-containing protein n=1 Tax=Chelativorans sp. YIM 93263 TaxID=2906648 RepID=UPI002379D392|nr:DUF4167 domain-containing protein [Chelativorans sp. YIM 93263]
MRPQQQNRRMRGRGGNNSRKGPNPLSRSYESNGPDVKIRGTAQQVADKYATLARDAQSSGDRVIAENYLQHAEHYNRIIAAAQAQQQAQQQNQQPSRDDRDDVNGDFNEREDRDQQEGRRDQQEGREASASAADQPRRKGDQQQEQRIDDGSGPQPEFDGVPVEVILKEGEKNRANGAANGHDKAAKSNGEDKVNGAGAKKASKSADNGDVKKTAAGEAEEKPKRIRRTRAKKTVEPSDSDKKTSDSSDNSESKSEEAATAE